MIWRQRFLNDVFSLSFQIKMGKRKHRSSRNNAGENGEQGSDCQPVCQDCGPFFSDLEAKLKALKRTTISVRRILEVNVRHCSRLEQVIHERNKKIAEKDLIIERLKQEIDMLQQNLIEDQQRLIHDLMSARPK